MYCNSIIWLILIDGFRELKLISYELSGNPANVPLIGNSLHNIKSPKNIEKKHQVLTFRGERLGTAFVKIKRSFMLLAPNCMIFRLNLLA